MALAVIFGLLGLSASALPAHAFSQLDFGIIAPTGGMISFSGALGDPLISTDVAVDEVVGLGTPANANTPVEIVDGLLNFHTGGSTTQPGDPQWTFEGGGEITISGKIPAIGLLAETELLNGTFDVAHVIPVGLIFRVAVAEFIDVKNTQLAEHFGLPSDSSHSFKGYLNLSFLAFGGTTPSQLEQGFESFTMLSGDVVNTPTLVPVPATPLTGGVVLSVLALVTMRRLRTGFWLPCSA